MPRTYKRKTDRPYNNTKEQTLPMEFRPGFLSELDKRTGIAQTLKSNFEEIVADIGGSAELSHTKRALIERFVWLEAMLQSIEHQMVTEGISAALVSRWVYSINALQGLAVRIGLERKQRVVDLNSYLTSADQ
jgi:hypothetical protein